MTPEERDYDDRFLAACKALEGCPRSGSRWRHRNGGLYVVQHGCLIEATLTPAVAYITADYPGTVHATNCATWIRPLAEFLDGRFTEAPEADR